MRKKKQIATFRLIAKKHCAGNRLLAAPVKTSLSAVALLAIVLSLAGCGPQNYLNDNDKLRAQNLHLQQQVQQLQNNLQLQKGHVATLEKQLHPAPVNLPNAQIPVLSKLEMARFSGLTKKHDGQPAIRLYVRTLDQQGRMMPVAGKAKLVVVAILNNGKPQIIAQRDYSPKQLDGAYRYTFAGTHYVFDLPLKQSMLQKVNQITAKVILTQARTGRVFTLQEVFKTDEYK